MKELSKLREFIIKMNIQQKELAEKLGYTEQYISEIANGKRPMTASFMERLIKVYPDTREEWLYNIDDFFTDREYQQAKYYAEKKRKNLLRSCSDAADRLIELVAKRDNIAPVYDGAFKRELLDYISFKLYKTTKKGEDG